MKKGKLVFLDESGVNVNMTRFYGRAKGKKRVYDYVPAKRIKRTTLLSSVRLDGTIVKKVFQGALNGKIFQMYKFRSMKMNAPDLRNKDNSTYNSSNDPRVTHIGKILRKT